VAETDVPASFPAPIATKRRSDRSLRVAARHAHRRPRAKTPLEEARETLTTLEVIYDAPLAQKDLFEKAPARYGYASEGVKIRKPLIRPSAWTLGDGDGNPAITGEALEDGIRASPPRIAARYIESLEAPSASFSGQAALRRRSPTLGASPIPSKIRQRSVRPCPCRPTPELADGPIRKALSDLAYVVDCFGLGFAPSTSAITARDPDGGAARLAHVANVIDERVFSNLAPAPAGRAAVRMAGR